jgi:hypothetical protein
MVAKTGQNPAHSPCVNNPASPRRAVRRQQRFPRQRPALLVTKKSANWNTDEGEDLTPFDFGYAADLSPLTDEDMALFKWTITSEAEMLGGFGGTIAQQSTEQTTKPRRAVHHKHHQRHRSISAKSAAAAVFQAMRGRGASNGRLFGKYLPTEPTAGTQPTLANKGRGIPKKRISNSASPPVLTKVKQGIFPPETHFPSSTMEQPAKKRKRGRPRNVIMLPSAH